MKYSTWLLEADGKAITNKVLVVIYPTTMQYIDESNIISSINSKFKAVILNKNFKEGDILNIHAYTIGITDNADEYLNALELELTKSIQSRLDKNTLDNFDKIQWFDIDIL